MGSFYGIRIGIHVLLFGYICHTVDEAYDVRVHGARETDQSKLHGAAWSDDMHGFVDHAAEGGTLCML